MTPSRPGPSALVLNQWSHGARSNSILLEAEARLVFSGVSNDSTLLIHFESFLASSGRRSRSKRVAPGECECKEGVASNRIVADESLTVASVPDRFFIVGRSRFQMTLAPCSCGRPPL